MGTRELTAAEQHRAWRRQARQPSLRMQAALWWPGTPRARPEWSMPLMPACMKARRGTERPWLPVEPLQIAAGRCQLLGLCRHVRRSSCRADAAVDQGRASFGIAVSVEASMVYT